ncbi:HAD hydrolase family protein [Endozoicomonas gorgoniicola]|uniref:3-deoxy-D-manno-octulosonate 8-phosphate phosphatase KdsC n=1 Tax=Endozoicomonas gorgoniicola TaxID=1234144 RepID=A0ABT3N3M1_9GAMM|nr:HAD hydrolase family protein [Endozoicomonas gorgoniicola]MCW7556206.1 HAD hydrolase family protein [Endozoicomonas gorgoniicola]
MIDSSLKPSAAKVRLAVFDVDGVLTDGKLFFGEQGEALKCFHTLDGHGLKMLQQAGIKTAIITGRRSTFVEKRASDLGVDFLYQGREDKINALNELLEAQHFSMDEIAYLGDDLPDLPVIRRVGFGCAVINAHPFVRQHAQAVTDHHGGLGAAREFCDFILDAQGKLEPMLAEYL